jgi:hypothetical protein
MLLSRPDCRDAGIAGWLEKHRMQSRTIPKAQPVHPVEPGADPEKFRITTCSKKARKPRPDEFSLIWEN